MSIYLDNKTNRQITDYADGYRVIDEASGVEAEPAYFIPTGNAATLRTYVKVTGGLTALTLRLWFYVQGDWYQGPTTDEGDPLNPGVSSARDWEVSSNSIVGFTVSSLTGAGTVSVIAEEVSTHGSS